MHANKTELVSSIGSRPCHSCKRARKNLGIWDGFSEDLNMILSLILISRLPHQKCVFLPAAGNRWNDDLNNAGSNGNYWSSTQNPSNSNNAYNLNFNSGNANWNNNNRNNGHTVRPVSSTYLLYIVEVHPFLYFFVRQECRTS